MRKQDVYVPGIGTEILFLKHQRSKLDGLFSSVCNEHVSLRPLGSPTTITKSSRARLALFFLRLSVLFIKRLYDGRLIGFIGSVLPLCVTQSDNIRAVEHGSTVKETAF